MERYDPDRKCPKCGGDASTVANGVGSMTRRCRRCDWIWFEEPLDASAFAPLGTSGHVGWPPVGPFTGQINDRPAGGGAVITEIRFYCMNKNCGWSYANNLTATATTICPKCFGSWFTTQKPQSVHREEGK